MAKEYVTRKKYVKQEKPAARHRTNENVVTLTPDKEEESLERARQRRLLQKAKTLFKTAKEARKRYDWEWLTRDLYRRGYQFSRYNPSNRTVILSGRSLIKIPVNLTWAQMRVIKNQVTSFRPKWEVLPTGKSEESLTTARYSGKLLDYYYDRLNLRKITKETVIQALMYSVGGPWQIGYDPDLDNGDGSVFIWLLDPYDFFVDPMGTSLDDAEYCCKAVRRPLNEIKTNPNYKFYEDLERGEFKQAESEYKQFLLQALKFYTTQADEEQDGGIVKEFSMKVRVDDNNKKDLAKELRDNDQDDKDLHKGEVLIRVITYLDFLFDPMRVQLLRRDDFQYEMYQGDINPRELYGESWIKHVIPINRVLNQLESSVFEYNYRYAKGRIVIDKNSGVRMIANEHGSIIEKNPGAEVTSLALNPFPASYAIQIENMRRYLEDVGGAHDISLGKIPTGVKSGVGIAELKSADATNQRDLVDNLEDFLVKVGKKVLKEIAENYDVPKVIKALGKGGDPEHFAIIGEKGVQKRKNKKTVKIGIDELDIAKIGKDNEIRVQIGSWLAYTKDAQHDKLKELYEAGIIDQKTFLEHAEFSDVQNIIERTREQALLEKYRGTSAEGVQVSDEEIADQENFQMVKEGKPAVEGGVWPQPEDRHQIHNVIHQEYADHPEVSKHMFEHDRMIKLGITGPQQMVGAPGVVPGQPEQGEVPPVPQGSPVPQGPQLPPPIGIPTPGMAGIGVLPPGLPIEQTLIQ